MNDECRTKEGSCFCDKAKKFTNPPKVNWIRFKYVKNTRKMVIKWVQRFQRNITMDPFFSVIFTSERQKRFPISIDTP